ncbi:FtsX-like permease family protein [Bacillus sp. CH30_1T]|uniref:ABC transporter permease n=1 Tax=Bacillus sp. CH30_1T TaxID=2604836 RepID=UPI0011F012C6|nr:FtsX-like permease family protein [Bacillus sp. CH30_1T]KAA0566698.1 FtsX-like permease family protein [Bacillus sp. CH30_1T]
MNIINKLTLRHLKENKRRTLVTITGVIISVSMIMAVATLGVSFLDIMKRQSIADNGEWHAKYHNVSPDQIEAIANDEDTGDLLLSNDFGYAKLDGAKVEEKPYLFIKEYNAEGLKQFPVELSKGRLPSDEQEVVISEQIENDAGVKYEIGDQIKLDIGARMMEGEGEPLGQNDPLQRDEEGIIERLEVNSTETFTVTGIIESPSWEPAWSPGYTVLGYIDMNSLNKSDMVDAIVVLDKVDSSVFEHAGNLAKENGIEKVAFNDELLRYYGVTDNDNLRFTLFSLLGIIMAVIIIGSVSLIYNAFAISVSERARHLGMLSSVGATKKQKRNSVFFEGMIIGVISIPLGLLAGAFGIGATFWFINTYIDGALGISERLQVVVTPSTVLVSCLISSVTIFISTYIPARKASKISAIDAIRQTQDVKLTGKTVKTSKLVRKLFGLEAEIGLKNLKRNKRRYHATIFSLVISIVLFLSVSFFTDNLKKSAVMSQEGTNFDISVSANTGDTDQLEDLVHMENVTAYSIHKSLNPTVLIDKDKFPQELKDMIKRDNISLDDGRYQYYVNFHGLDEQSFTDFAKKAGADLEMFDDPEKPTAIVIDQISYYDLTKSKFINAKSIVTEPGDVLDLIFTDYATEKSKPLGSFTIGATTDKVPMGARTSVIGGLDVIVPVKTMDALMDEEMKKEVRSQLYINSTDPMETQKALEEVLPSNLYIYNVYQDRQQEEQLILFMSVFTYGFIALISLISIANIFNTISTSISLRKREFAMLKSVGMTPKGFNKMINYESIFYGVKALLYGLPISIGVMYLIHKSVGETFDYGFVLPWFDILSVIAAIFIVVSSAMLYSIGKVKKQNIIEGLKQENI